MKNWNCDKYGNLQEFRLFVNLHIMERRRSISLQWRWLQEERRLSMKYVARCKDDEIPGAPAMQYLVCSVFLSSMKAVFRGTEKQAWTNEELERAHSSRNEILTRFLVEKWTMTSRTFLKILKFEWSGVFWFHFRSY